MICTFCGNENPPGNRFCGMCGVRLERRKEERRTNESGSTKCASCGHVNEPRYKFCGMCGTRVDRRTQDRRGSEQKVRATAMANAQLPTPEPRRTVVQYPLQGERRQAPTRAATALAERTEYEAEEHRSHPSLGGPSFLGLNEPQAESDYLLEEEGSSGHGVRTMVLIVILMAILGLIYVQYRSNLSASSKSADESKPNPAAAPQSQAKNQQPSSEKALAAVAGAANLQAAARNAVKATDTSASDKNDDPAPKKATKGKTSAEMDEDETARSKSDPVVETKSPSAALIKAQQYLHGRSVPQSCEQGLIYLKAATEQNDPQAAVQMAALYSSGFCVQQDRVKAYRWFSSAQEMNPNNRWIAKNMSQLWAQMTSDERRQIR